MITKIVHISAIVLVVNVFSLAVQGNSTKPVRFLTSPPASAPQPSDSKNSESRVNEKQSVSSHGYQREVINDSTEEEAEAQERSGSENIKPLLSGLYPQAVADQPSGLFNQFYQTPDYDENSAKEEIKDPYRIPTGKISYGDVRTKTDISKVRDIFIDKEVNGGKGHLQSPHATVSYPSSAAPLESKYKLEYESPVTKYGNTPIVLKQAILPLVEPSPISAPAHSSNYPQGLLDVEVTGHTAGYGHGFHHHQQKLKSKPLKPSVVYRDPSDHFDHHDKIRTLDKDHYGGIEKDSRHPYGPHVIGKEIHGYGHGKKVVFEPFHYDQSKIPECAHKNKYIYNLTFCVDDPHYPHETIVWAIKESGIYAKKLLSDVTYQSADNLVTGLTRAEEEGYTYKHYFGATHAQNVHLDKYKPPYQGYSYSTDYFKKGGYICPSDIYYARPKRAMNTFGKWKVIINLDHVPEHGYDKYGHGHHGGHGIGGHQVGGHFNKGHGHEPEIYAKDHHGHHDEPHVHLEKEFGHDSNHYGKGHDYGHEPQHQGHHNYGHDSYGPEHHSIKKREYKEKKSYTQTLRLEQCIYPKAPCSYVDSHLDSRCIQKHNFVRLVAWTKEEGIHVDTFKMPIACSCHVRQPIHFYHESGHHETKQGHIVPPIHNYHGHGNQHGHHNEHHHHGGGLQKVY